MKATTLLTLHTRKLLEIAGDILRNGRSRESALVTLIESVMAQIALEEAALSALARAHVPIAASLHAVAHTRARLALFRLATERETSAAFANGLRGLVGIFGGRAFGIVLALCEAFDDATLEALTHAFERRLSLPTVAFQSDARTPPGTA